MATSRNMEEDFKLPLRLWLIKQIDSQKYKGLEWMHRERKTFKIPWTAKHYPKWDDHFQIFIAWAKHRGTFDPNNIDEKKLKGNFRCALNKSDDFEELKGESKLKQQTDNYRVYRVLQPDEVIAIKKNRKRKLPPKKQPNSLTNPPNEKIPTTESNAPGTSNWNYTTGNIINVDPNTPHSAYEENGYTLPPNPMLNQLDPIIPPPDLDLIDNNFSLNMNVMGFQTVNNTMNQSNNMQYPILQGSNMTTQSNSHYQTQNNFQTTNNFATVSQADVFDTLSPGPLSPSEYVVMESPGELKLSNSLTNEPSLNQEVTSNKSFKKFCEEMQIPTDLLSQFRLSAMYGSKVYLSEDVELKYRVRVLYGTVELQKAIYDACPTDVMNQGDIFDSPGIELPEYKGDNKHIPKILDKTDLGIEFHYENGILYGRRLCQSQVFYYGNFLRDAVVTKMNRGEMTELFSLKKYFLEVVESAKIDRSRNVDGSVTLVIGTKPNLGAKHHAVSLNLEPKLSKMLQKTFNPSSFTSLAMSDANSLDNLIRTITSLDLS